MKKSLITTLVTTAILLVSSIFTTGVSYASVFQPAASLQEAEQIAKQSYRFIIYKNSQYGETIPEEARLDRLNRINRELHRMHEDLALNLPVVSRLHMIARNRGIYNPGRDEIVFSMKNTEHTIRHELGHVIDIRKGINNAEWKNLVRTLQEKYGFAPSAYARTNDSEYWAEAFAYYTSPEYGKSIGRFPAELESYMVNVIDGMKNTGGSNLAYNKNK